MSWRVFVQRYELSGENGTEKSTQLWRFYDVFYLLMSSAHYFYFYTKLCNRFNNAVCLSACRYVIHSANHFAERQEERLKNHSRELSMVSDVFVIFVDIIPFLHPLSFSPSKGCFIAMGGSCVLRTAIWLGQCLWRSVECEEHCVVEVGGWLPSLLEMWQWERT